MLHEWNPKFKFLHEFFSKFQTKLAGHRKPKHHMVCDCAPKFEVKQMLGELMAGPQVFN